MLPLSLVFLVFSHALVASARGFSWPNEYLAPILGIRQAAANSTSNSTCGVTLASNTTAKFNIIHNNNATNTTNNLQALLITHWDLTHADTTAPCKGNTTINNWYDSFVGTYRGPYVDSDSFAYSVINPLRDAIRTNNTADTVIIESCTTDPKFAGQNMGVIFTTWSLLPQVQNALSTWSSGGCVVTNATKNTNAQPWQSFSMKLRGPPPSANTTTTVSSSIISTSKATGTSSLISSSVTSKATVTSSAVSSSSKAATVSSSTKAATTTKAAAKARSVVKRADCRAIQVNSGDSCGSLADRCGISGSDFTKYNPKSDLCSTLAPGQHVCCSAGTLPDYSPKPQSDGTCAVYKVASGDSCSAIASANSITTDQITSFNNNTWGFPGCANLQASSVICLSTGNPPMPASIDNAVCGPQVPGTQKPANISTAGALASLNPCPLKVCCDIFGQCGNTDEFCTVSKSASGAPGTAAPGQNGCISNCGTDIVKSSAPAKTFTVGYFEGFNVERPCLNMDASQIDTTKYSHLHFGFADLTKSYDVTMDGNLTDQWKKFLALSGPSRLVSFGGWAFSTEVDTYQIFRDGVTANNRQTMANNIANFVKSSGADGVDFDWEYPGAPDIPGIPAASPQNGQDYLAFLKLLRAALPSGKLISLSAPASYWYLRDYPIADMSKVVDYIVYMTYDLHGQWDYNNKYSDPGCPSGNCLRSQVNSTETNTALSMITKAGVPSNKILVGVTSYGRSFQMTQSGCTGPMCTYTGPDSGATPGVCTGTAGYLAQAEIKDILANDKSAKTFYDDASQSDIMVYNNTQWVGYMSDNTRIARTRTYLSQNFLGTAEWAIDLASYSQAETEANTPLPDCPDFDKYKDVDSIIAQSGIPSNCVNTYIINALSANMTGSLSQYKNILNDGYSGKYKAYARQVRSEGYWAWQDVWAHQNDYWNCFQTRGGKNVTTTCTNVIGTAGDFYYVLKDQTGFCKMLSDKYALDCSYIHVNAMPYHTTSGGVACQRFGDCPSGGTLYWPDLDRDFPVLDPSQAITGGLSNYTGFSDWLADTAMLANVGMNPASNADVVDGSSSIVYGLSGSVQAMQTVADVGEQAEKEQRKQMILAFITAFLLVIPGVGEAAEGVAALAAVARIAKIVDFAGNAALDIYGVVQDPSSAPMAVAGILFGGIGLRDSGAWTKAAGKSRGMSQDIIKSMGNTVATGMGKVKQACKECHS